jgi:iron complex outermembrane receptor protein
VSKVFSGFGKGLGMPAGNATAWLVPDIDKYAALLNIYSNTGIYALTGTNNTSARGQYGAVEEDTRRLCQAEFRFDALRPALPGRRRRAPRQHQAGVGRLRRRRRRHPAVEVKREYDLTLPSFNLAADVTDTIVARVSAAKTIARPGIGSLSPGGDVAVQGANRTFSSGNPYLDPTQSKNFDLSLEWYPSRARCWPASFFFKKIDTFVATTRNEARLQHPGPAGLAAERHQRHAGQVFQVTKPVNSDGGNLKGFEVNCSSPSPSCRASGATSASSPTTPMSTPASSIRPRRSGRADGERHPGGPVEERRQR